MRNSLGQQFSNLVANIIITWGTFKNPVSQVTSHIITVDSLGMRSRHHYFLNLFILFNFSIVDLQCRVN